MQGVPNVVSGSTFDMVFYMYFEDSYCVSN
jgi:hypothetical protein